MCEPTMVKTNRASAQYKTSSAIREAKALNSSWGCIYQEAQAFPLCSQEELAILQVQAGWIQAGRRPVCVLILALPFWSWSCQLGNVASREPDRIASHCPLFHMLRKSLPGAFPIIQVVRIYSARLSAVKTMCLVRRQNLTDLWAV